MVFDLRSRFQFHLGVLAPARRAQRPIIAHDAPLITPPRYAAMPRATAALHTQRIPASGSSSFCERSEAHCEGCVWDKAPVSSAHAGAEKSIPATATVPRIFHIIVFISPSFLPKPSLLARFLDESVFVALEFFDALGAGTFPLIHGVHLVPCVEELLLLAAEAVLVIAVRHIKGSASYLPL